MIYFSVVESHSSFDGYQTDRIVSISSGVLGKNSLNYDNALQIGHEVASKITGKNFHKLLYIELTKLFKYII